MIEQKDIINYLKANKNRFAEQFNILQIGVFGSYARNEHTENSDIDIIIDMPKGTENIFEKRLMLKELLSNHFSKHVDVCHQRAIKPIFREMILKDAIYA
ncbi:MAG: nucleotidyltransferase domain-containing protein [Bacteroidota bacterium]|nr:nucleotidyltransferase domain-containing protein [Bacteroidota bacterium]